MKKNKIKSNFSDSGKKLMKHTENKENKLINYIQKKTGKTRKEILKEVNNI